MATIIRGGKRFDSREGRFVQNGSICIEGKTISSVDGGPTETNDTVLDATGKTLIPGLMNLHGHLGWDGFSDLEAQTRHDLSLIHI